MTAVAPALLLTCLLPSPLVELPSLPTDQLDAAAAALTDHLFTGLPATTRSAVLARYRDGLRRRGDLGPAVVALAQGRVGDQASACLLTVRLLASTHDDADVAARGVLSALRSSVLGCDGEVRAVQLPVGPGVLRLRRGLLRPGACAEPVEVPVAVLDVLAPVPGERAAVVLDLVCPTPDDLPRHAALAGAVAASVRVGRAA